MVFVVRWLYIILSGRGIAACCSLLFIGFTLVQGCQPAPKPFVEISWATNQHYTRMDAIAHFEKENPDIRVKIRPISEPRQFFLQCLYGDAPDVITFFQVDTFQSFARNGLLLPLNSDDYMSWPFYRGLRDYCFRRDDDVLMALPQVAYPYVLYFNKRLVPQEKALDVSNWEDLLVLIESLLPRKSKSGKRVFGLDIHNDLLWFTTWYWQRGGRIFTPGGDKLILDRAKAVETLDAMKKWRSRTGIIPRPSDRLNLPSKGASQGVLGSLFLQGRALFYWSGSWKICDFVNQDKVEWGIRPVPAGPVNDLTILGGNSFGVSTRSKHPRQAKQFVNYLASLTGQQRLIRHQIYMPARPACPIPSRYRILKDQIARARTLEYSSRFNEALLKEIFKQTLEAHRLGLFTSEQVVKALEEGLQTGSVVISYE
ncbi:MAG: hypothetical protein B1H11_03535 [Desulfobacteraceae bacterium 4484_190.1]|nr:MAG: hypothetical protein B1H11_03535 [Desulfobacteraceae bacterium 4484_190.1]